MTHSWDNPAKLGHPSQNGTTQPNWDSPPMWDVPHRVGRLNRLGRPMKEWDDPAVGHPTPSPGHTTQAGTSHTNWSIPSFSRLLRSLLTREAHTPRSARVRRVPPAPSGARAAAGPLDLIDLFALSYRAPRAALPAPPGTRAVLFRRARARPAPPTGAAVQSGATPRHPIMRQ